MKKENQNKKETNAKKMKTVKLRKKLTKPLKNEKETNKPEEK